MLTFFHYLLNNIQNLGIIGYTILFLSSLLTSTIIFGYIIPGMIIAMTFGALAGNLYYNIYFIILISTIGDIIGNIINYNLGYRTGKKAFKKGFLFIKPDHFEKAKLYINKYGIKSLILGKLIPGLRESISFIIGIFKIDFKKYIKYNIIGSIIWNLIFIGLGYFFSKNLNLAEKYAFYIGILILIILTFYSLYILIKNIKK